ncbi:hypothetical protein RFI_07766, partial [Reticulomyxa filosa]
DAHANPPANGNGNGNGNAVPNLLTKEMTTRYGNNPITHNAFEFRMEPSKLAHACYTQSIDVYSFGVIMWEVGNMQEAYQDMSVGEIAQMILSGNRLRSASQETRNENVNHGFYHVPDHVFTEYNAILNDCWTHVPTQRPTFAAIAQRLEQLLQSITK